MTETYRKVFARWGAPLETMEVRFVHGKMFRCLVPLVGADRNGPPPPRRVRWPATRVHPAFRRREKAARRMLVERSYLDDINGWYTTERQTWIDRNLHVQAVDPASRDDAGLAEHLGRPDRHLLDGWLRLHNLHGSDLGPLGDLLAHGTTWGLDPVDLLGLPHGITGKSRMSRARPADRRRTTPGRGRSDDGAVAGRRRGER